MTQDVDERTCSDCGGLFGVGGPHECDPFNVWTMKCIQVGHDQRQAEAAIIEAARNHVCPVAPWFRLQRCKLCISVDALDKVLARSKELEKPKEGK